MSEQQLANFLQVSRAAGCTLISRGNGTITDASPKLIIIFLLLNDYQAHSNGRFICLFPRRTKEKQ